jgi:hypothetical protein
MKIFSMDITCKGFLQLYKRPFVLKGSFFFLSAFLSDPPASACRIAGTRGADHHTFLPEDLFL